MVLIHTRRGLGVQMRVGVYLWIRMDKAGIWDVTCSSHSKNFRNI